jgi:hypothetical protein
MALTRNQKRRLNQIQRMQTSAKIANSNSVSGHIPLYKIIPPVPAEPTQLFFDVQYISDKIFGSDVPWSFHFRGPYYIAANAGRYKDLIVKLVSYNAVLPTGSIPTELPPFYLNSSLNGTDFNPYIAVLSSYSSDTANGNSFSLVGKGIEDSIFNIKLYSDTNVRTPVTSNCLLVDLALRFMVNVIY